jgi:hypothetical protein
MFMHNSLVVAINGFIGAIEMLLERRIHQTPKVRKIRKSGISIGSVATMAIIAPVYVITGSSLFNNILQDFFWRQTVLQDYYITVGIYFAFIVFAVSVLRRTGPEKQALGLSKLIMFL